MRRNSSKLIVATLAGALLVTPVTVTNATESNTIEFKWGTVIGESNSNDSMVSKNNRGTFYVSASATEEFLAQIKEFDNTQNLKPGEQVQLETRDLPQADFSTTEGIQTYESAQQEVKAGQTKLDMPGISSTIFSTATISENGDSLVEVAANSTTSDTEQEVSAVPNNAVVNVSEEDIVWLRKIVAAEAGNQPYEGKAAVAEVVLNRVKSSKFKQNSVVGVIFAKHQFQPVSNGTIYTAYGKMSAKVRDEIDRAVDEALRGSNYCEGALFFRADYFFSGRKQIKSIGDHYFSK